MADRLPRYLTRCGHDRKKWSMPGSRGIRVGSRSMGASLCPWEFVRASSHQSAVVAGSTTGRDQVPDAQPPFFFNSSGFRTGGPPGCLLGR